MKRIKIICKLMAFFLIVSASIPVYANNKKENKQDLIEKVSVMVPLLCENLDDVC